jgi:inositol-pentakisphosphate 2-kinase
VLAKLKHLQQSLDPFDIEGLFSLDPLPLQPPRVSEWEAFVTSFRSPHSIFLSSEASPRDHTLSYLLSSTFKDCSIVLSFRVPHNLVSYYEPLEGIKFDRVSLIDLDEKPIEKIMKYKQLDEELVSNFKEVVKNEEPLKCI